jgi:hypothetical protein
MDKLQKLLGAVFFIVLVSGMTCGCAVKNVNGHRGWVIMPQVGVVVTVQNNCAANLSVESLYGNEVKNLAFGESATIPIASRPFSGYNREIWVMVKAYDNALKYIGSAELREYADTYSGTRDKLWQVDDLDSPSGARCKTP